MPEDKNKKLLAAGLLAPLPVRRPRGHPRTWTDEQIRRLYETYDVDQVDDLARKAGRRVDSLWRAGVILAILGAVRRKAGESTLKWAPAKQRYVAPSGAVVVRGEIRDAVKAVVKVTKQEMVRLVEGLATARLSVPEFQTLAIDALTRGHFLAAGIASGGQTQVSNSTRSVVGKLAGADIGAVERLLTDVTTGKIPLAGRFLQRLSLITLAVRATFYEAERNTRTEAGFVWARRMLTEGEHCEESPGRPGCVELAAEGWVPIEDLVPIGDATCLDNCNCEVIYSNDPRND